MTRTIRHLRTLAVLALTGAGLLAWPAAAAAQTVSGSATAVQANVLGVTTALADTGPLADASDLLEASTLESGILSLGSADVLHAAKGASPDSIASEASLADAGLSVAGNFISAAFVMARALAPAGGTPVGTSEIDGLSINGAPIAVTGQPNQTVWLFGGRVILNEQIPTSTGTTVNAVHIIVSGVADVVLATASAGASGSSGSSLPPLPLPPLF
jgi:hypothetical protein